MDFGNILDDFFIALGAAWNDSRYFFELTWWIWAFLILAPIFRHIWLFWRQELFRRDSKYAILEIFIARELEKGPRAMDQVFQAICALENTCSDFEECYLDGEVPRPFTFEVISFGGETHFYVRCYHKVKALVQSAFLAHYPNIEIEEVEDYMGKLPRTLEELYSKNYDVYGTELILAREPIFPTRTYLDFEVPDEEQRVDSIGSILEVMGKLKKDEFIGVQINAIGIGGSWTKKPEYKTMVEELRETMGQDEETGAMTYRIRTPRQTKVLEAVENNLSKPGFECVIRLIYFSPKGVYYDSFPRRGIIGAFNQYAATDLNSFRQNFDMMTLTKILFFPYIFPVLRATIRKKRILRYYRERVIPSESVMGPASRIGRWMRSSIWNWDHTQFTTLTSSILATIWHPPTNIVLTAPHLRRAESKKTGPSSGLPIYGHEEDIQQFK